MSNPEQPPTPENPITPDETSAAAPQPTQLPPASELPQSTPLASEPIAPAAEPFTPAETQVLPPVDPNAATQAFPAADPAAPAYPGAPEAPAYGAPVPPVAPGAPYGAAQQPGAQAPMNTLAIVSLVGSFFVSLVGIICGHIALKQIKRDGTRGRGLALAGTIIGYVALAGQIIAGIFLVIALIAGAAAAGSAQDEFEKQLESQLGDTSSEITETPAPDTSDVPSATDFCGILEESASLSVDDPAAVADTYERLAATTPSDANAELYSKLAKLTRDPAAILDDPDLDITAFQEQVTSALMEDAATCL